MSKRQHKSRPNSRERESRTPKLPPEKTSLPVRRGPLSGPSSVLDASLMHVETGEHDAAQYEHQQ